MKNFSIFLFIFICIFTCCSCSKKTEQTYALNNLEKNVAYDLEQIDNNFNDETLKTLSVIFRTNHKINNDYENFNFQTSNKYENIVSKTQNEVLVDNEDLAFISINNNNENEWTKKINKSEILNYAYENDILLSNVKDIKTNFNDEQLTEIIIANKNFDYKNFAKKFNLNSNKITKIENNKTSLVFYGKGNSFYKNLDIQEIENKSNLKNSYKIILNEFFENLEIKN